MLQVGPSLTLSVLKVFHEFNYSLSNWYECKHNLQLRVDIQSFYESWVGLGFRGFVKKDVDGYIFIGWT